MIKRTYFSFKEYILGPENDLQQDVFEKVKIDLLFNLFVIFSFIYFLGFARIIADKDWLLLIIRAVGIVIPVLFFVALKQTKHYKVPGMLWSVGLVILGIQGLLINHGNLTFANLGFALLNLAVVVLLLNKYLKIIFYGYYVLFISYGLSVKFGILSAINFGASSASVEHFVQDRLIFSAVPVFLLIYVLYIFVTYEFKVNRQLTDQIDFVKQQEEEIKTANQSMYKSIQLASRIQKAFLPNFNNYQSFFKDHFVLLNPKQDLSGDFYWVSAHEDNFYFAVVDSAENNVTGAIVSSVYYDALDTAVKEEKLTATNDIIKSVNLYIEAKADIDKLKEGIKISIARVDKSTRKVYFSGEQNSLYVACSGKKVIDEYKAEQYYENADEINYREACFDFNGGDILYMMSDGFSAHFKGFDNVKFKESVVKTFLVSIKNKPLKSQAILLEGKLKEWIDDGIQTDDVCVVGITL